MPSKYNWVGMIGGVATLSLIAISWFVPWWQFSVGNPALAEANFSPVNLNFSLFNNSVVIPLIWAMNMVALLSLASGGIIMLIYSVVPAKSYSKRLLSFSYNKPLIAVIFFVVELLALTILAESIAGFSIPLSGSSVIQLPQSLTHGTNVSVDVMSMIGWPFWLAIVVSGICVAARLLHGKLVGPDGPKPD